MFSIVKKFQAFKFKVYYTILEKVKFHQEQKSNRVNLIWWSTKKNLGDYLSKLIFDWMLDKNNLDNIKHNSAPQMLMGVGSVILLGVTDATVWGSGILSVEQIPNIFKKAKFRKLDVRAVRGPFTRHTLISAGYDCPEIYGDPAILMPYIYNPEDSNKKYEVSIIEHFSKSNQIKNENFHYINIETYDYKYFIDEICSSQKVISSSLHGIILAETYGVPAVFLSDGMEDQLFKFWDWYLSTGRTNIKVAKTLEEALQMEPMPLPQLDQMRNNLIKSFPLDLWNE